jgi:hypothetical protein
MNGGEKAYISLPILLPSSFVPLDATWRTSLLRNTMRLNTVFVLAAAASAISATDLDTNAQRMARGLPPFPPVRRATPVAGMFLCSGQRIFFHVYHHQSCEKDSSIGTPRWLQYWIPSMLYVLF